MSHPKDGKNKLDFQMQNVMPNFLKKKKKKKKIKKIKYLEARQAVNRELFFIISKRDRKKIFMSLITCELVSATIALFR